MNSRPVPSAARNSFRMRTSEYLPPQALQNEHLHDPLVSAHSKQLTARQLLSQLLYFQHLRAPLVTAQNTRLITPLECALTRNCSRNPFRMRTSEKHPGGRVLRVFSQLYFSQTHFLGAPICPLRGGRLMSQNEWLPPDAAPPDGYCASRNSRLSRHMS
jgi:hypothetical protein